MGKNPLKSPVVLFLDFDGVLHPLFASTGTLRGRVYEGPSLIHVDLLAELLAPHVGQLEIIIASSWARRRSLPELRQLMPPSLGDRVTGTVWDQHADPGLSRYALIVAWLARHRPNLDHRWLALDDDARGWPDSERQHLVWCSEPIGSASVQRELRRRLDELLEQESH